MILSGLTPFLTRSAVTTNMSNGLHCKNYYSEILRLKRNLVKNSQQIELSSSSKVLNLKYKKRTANSLSWNQELYDIEIIRINYMSVLLLGWGLESVRRKAFFNRVTRKSAYRIGNRVPCRILAVSM